MKWAKKQKGFTIVELIIVIVVIAIIATITIISYNGVQSRSRDTKRLNDVQTITQALELYYLENGQFPGSPTQTGGSGTINSGWSTTADASWQRLVDTLKPYAKEIGTDPKSEAGKNVLTGAGYNYAYFASASNYCGAAPYQMYILVYRLESSERILQREGECLSPGLLYGNDTDNPLSNYRVVK